jgi:hypothetical protein
MNLYTDPYRYIRAATGHDTSTVIGNLSRIASPGISIGATSIPLTVPTSKVLNVYDIVTIFDGSNSEEVTVTATANQGVSSITCSATQYAHATGTVIASDGTQGSLASMIANASAAIEAYCRQSLLQATHSNERLPLRSMRAAVTRDYQLILRPKQFPVTSVSACTATLDNTTTLTFDTSQAFIDADGQTVTLAQMSTTSGSTNWWGAISPPLYPTTPGWVQLSYTAGYTYAALPNEIHQACIWITSDLLSDRRNPTGAAETQYGDVKLTTRLRGDNSGRSVLVIRAYENLDRYRQRAF